MNKHTPGPWKFEVNWDGGITVYEAVTLQNIDICMLGGNAKDVRNARLIAAAPDLLEACQRVLTEYSAFAELFKIDTESEGVSACRSSVAKATGATS